MGLKFTLARNLRLNVETGFQKSILQMGLEIRV